MLRPLQKKLFRGGVFFAEVSNHLRHHLNPKWKHKKGGEVNPFDKEAKNLKSYDLMQRDMGFAKNYLEHRLVPRYGIVYQKNIIIVLLGVIFSLELVDT